MTPFEPPVVSAFFSDALVSYYLFMIAVLYPTIQILRRAGVSLLWAALPVIPFAGYCFLIIAMALVEWPAAPRRRKGGITS